MVKKDLSLCFNEHGMQLSAYAEGCGFEDPEEYPFL